MSSNNLLRKSILTIFLSFVTGFAYTFLLEALSKVPSWLGSLSGIVLFVLAILVCIITSKSMGKLMLAWVWSAFLVIGMIVGDITAVGLGVGIDDVSGLFITLTVVYMFVFSTGAFLVTHLFTKIPQKAIEPPSNIEPSHNKTPSSGEAFLLLLVFVVLFLFIFVYVRYPWVGVIPLALGFSLTKIDQKKLANGAAIAVFIFAFIPVLTGGLWSFNSVINELFFPLTYPLLIALGSYAGGLKPRLTKTGSNIIH